MRDATAGDPMSRKKWSRKDTRQISGALRQKGIDICANTVAMLLRSEGYSLRVNRKSSIRIATNNLKSLRRCAKHLKTKANPF